MPPDDLERVVLVQRLDPDRVDEYVDAHEDVPEAVTEAMDRGGVHEFRLFLHDDLSIGYIEVEDFEAFNEEYASDPECLEWEAFVGDFKRSGVDPDTGEMPVGEEIWTFEAD